MNKMTDVLDHDYFKGHKLWSKNNSIIVFICTDAWAPICIFLHVNGQNESVPIKTTDTLFFVGHDHIVTSMCAYQSKLNFQVAVFQRFTFFARFLFRS